MNFRVGSMFLKSVPIGRSLFMKTPKRFTSSTLRQHDKLTICSIQVAHEPINQIPTDQPYAGAAQLGVAAREEERRGFDDR